MEYDHLGVNELSYIFRLINSRQINKNTSRAQHDALPFDSNVCVSKKTLSLFIIYIFFIGSSDFHRQNIANDHVKACHQKFLIQKYS